MCGRACARPSACVCMCARNQWKGLAEMDGEVCKVTKPKYELTPLASFKIFLNMMVQPFIGLGLNNKQFMNHYYAKQAKHYDAYRQHMLHGKESLMYAVPWHAQAGKRVLLLAVEQGI